MIRTALIMALLLGGCSQIAQQSGASPTVVAVVDMGEQAACAAVSERMTLWEEVLLEAGERVLRRYCEEKLHQFSEPAAFISMERDFFDKLACDATIGEAYHLADDKFVVAWNAVCPKLVWPQ